MLPMPSIDRLESLDALKDLQKFFNEKAALKKT